MRQIILTISAIALTLALTSCNTVAGLGEDTQAAGRKIERAADRNM